MATFGRLCKARLKLKLTSCGWPKWPGRKGSVTSGGRAPKSAIFIAEREAGTAKEKEGGSVTRFGPRSVGRSFLRPPVHAALTHMTARPYLLCCALGLADDGSGPWRGRGGAEEEAGQVDG